MEAWGPVVAPHPAAASSWLGVSSLPGEPGPGGSGPLRAIGKLLLEAHGTRFPRAMCWEGLRAHVSSGRTPGSTAGTSCKPSTCCVTSLGLSFHFYNMDTLEPSSSSTSERTDGLLQGLFIRFLLWHHDLNSPMVSHCIEGTRLETR